MTSMKKILVKCSVFFGLSLLGLTSWIIIGALGEKPIVAGASWFELSLGLFAIWMIASTICEMSVGNSSLHNFIDMIAIIIAIIIVLTVGKFNISFESVAVAVGSMKWPFAISIVLAIINAAGSDLIAGVIKGKED